VIRNLLGQSAIYGLTTLVSRGANVLLLLALTLVLRPDDFGALSMIVTIGALANIIVPLAITQGQVRLASLAKREHKAAYATTAFWFTAVVLAVWLALTQIFAEPLCRWLIGPPRYLPAFRIGLLVMAINIAFDFVQSQFRWEFRIRDYTFVSLLFAVPTLIIAFALALTWPSALQGVLAGQVIAGSIAVAWGLRRLAASLGGRFERGKLREMLHITVPLVPASLAMLYTQYAGRFILNDLAGLDAVGVFSFASQIAGIAALALIGVQNAVTPLIMANFEDPDTPRVLGRSFELFTGFGLLAALALGLLAPDAIALAGNPRYASAGPLVLLLSLSVVAGGMYVFFPGFLISKKTGRQMWVAFAGVAASIALNYLLAARFGAMGAAIATLAATTFFLLLWQLFSSPLYAVPVRWAAVWSSALVTAAVGETALLLPHPDWVVALGTKAAAFAITLMVVVATGLIPLRDIRAGSALLSAKLRGQRLHGRQGQ
jgi:O-antigen/teichoic acid export membrane protein